MNRSGGQPAPAERLPAHRVSSAVMLRVAFIAAECEPWAKTGGLGDVVDALARALGRLSGGTSSTRRSTSSSRATAAIDRPPDACTATPVRVPDPLAPSGSTRGRDRRRRSQRLPAAPGRPPAGLRSRRLLRRPGAATTPTTRGGSGCSAGRRSRRSGADGRPVDVLHIHDWHAGPGRSSCATRVLRRRPGLGPAAAVHDDPQPRLSRLDAARARSAELGLAPGDGVVADGRRRHRPAAGGDRAVGAGEHGAARASRREALTPEFGMGLDGALRRARATGFFGILNGLDTDALGPGDRRGPRGAYSRRRPGRQGGLPGGPADAASASIRTMRRRCSG